MECQRDCPCCTSRACPETAVFHLSMLRMMMMLIGTVMQAMPQYVVTHVYQGSVRLCSSMQYMSCPYILNPCDYHQ